MHLHFVHLLCREPPLKEREEETVDEEDYGVYNASNRSHVLRSIFRLSQNLLLDHDSELTD